MEKGLVVLKIFKKQAGLLHPTALRVHAVRPKALIGHCFRLAHRGGCKQGPLAASPNARLIGHFGHDLATLIQTLAQYRHPTAVLRAMVFHRQNLRFRIQGVAAKHRRRHGYAGKALDASTPGKGFGGHANKILQRDGTYHQRMLPTGLRRIVVVVMQHGCIERVQRFHHIVLLAHRHTGAMHKMLPDCKVFKVESGALQKMPLWCAGVSE